MIKQSEIVKEIVKNIGLLDDQKIKKALDEQSDTKERLAKILVKFSYIASENVGNTLIPQLGIFPTPLKIEGIDLNAINVISPQIAVNHRIVPFRIQAKTVFLATDDPLNFMACGFFEKITSLDVNMVLSSQADIDNALGEFYL